MPAITIPFKNGINNTARVERLPEGFVREATNLNIDSSGIASQRDGFGLVITGEVTAVWSDDNRCFAVIDGDLKEVLSDYTVSTLRAGVGRVSIDFTRANGNYYYVGSEVTGVIAGVARSFGQEIVTRQPTLSEANGGALLAGKYLVAITLLDDSGMESGTAEPAVITLSTDNKAIRLTDLFVPHDARSSYLAVYVSTRDGSELFRQGIIATGTSEVTVYDIDAHTKPLDTVGIFPAPTGQLITQHYNHLFIAQGKTLFYSLPKQYERWNPFDNYQYPSKITALCPCESGLWVGTEKDGLFWISGRQPSHGAEALGDFSQAKKQHTSCPLLGSQQLIPAEFIAGGTGQYGYMVTAHDGMILLLDGGQFVNVSQQNVLFPEFNGCASAVIKHSDSFNYVAIVSGAKVPARSYDLQPYIAVWDVGVWGP
jgi:hypothetical protein